MEKSISTCDLNIVKITMELVAFFCKVLLLVAAVTECLPGIHSCPSLESSQGEA